MQAIILVGGYGTRLKSVINDVPKPMAPIQNQPFLAFLIHYLAQQGFKKIIFATHYLHPVIEHYFGESYQNIAICYAQEPEPLGTGGAIIHALQWTEPSPIFILNGDTFAVIDYKLMLNSHLQTAASLTMALCHKQDCSRYGSVIMENERVLAFSEKKSMGAGWINAGVYLTSAEILRRDQKQKKFSFEHDFLIPYAKNAYVHGFLSEDYFIDIGIPEDYARAQLELPALVNF